MKRAWVYIIIGNILIIEGTARVILGILGGNYLLLSGKINIPFGGLLTGWLLGGWLLRKGLKRRKEAFNDSIKTRI